MQDAEDGVVGCTFHDILQDEVILGGSIFQRFVNVDHVQLLYQLYLGTSQAACKLRFCNVILSYYLLSPWTSLQEFLEMFICPSTSHWYKVIIYRCRSQAIKVRALCSMGDSVATVPPTFDYVLCNQLRYRRSHCKQTLKFGAATLRIGLLLLPSFPLLLPRRSAIYMKEVESETQRIN